MISRVVLLVAQGFGLGRVRLAPGTFGSLLGLVWFLVLLWPGHLGIFTLGALGGALISVWVCGKAERILERTDPPSVVLDEIIAVPLCYAGCVAALWLETGEMPSPGLFFTGPACWNTAGILVAFRIFDIAKPWPIRRSQKLPGGWGVTLDDVIAAVYVNAVVAARQVFLA